VRDVANRFVLTITWNVRTVVN